MVDRHQKDTEDRRDAGLKAGAQELALAEGWGLSFWGEVERGFSAVHLMQSFQVPSGGLRGESELLLEETRGSSSGGDRGVGKSAAECVQH